MQSKAGCQGCRSSEPLPAEITMAFQPIIDLKHQRVWGYEALVRGVKGESAGQILSLVTDENRYKFDQACRVKAIELAAELLPGDGEEKLSINFMPNAVYEPSACIRATLDACKRTGFRPERLNFEFTENERMDDTAHVENIIAVYSRLGFSVSLDDFGAGYAGLKLLANFRPDHIKLDRELVCDVDSSPARQAIVASMASLAAALDITVVAEGVETEAELSHLRATGIHLFQGYLFARPGLETLPKVQFMSNFDLTSRTVFG